MKYNKGFVDMNYDDVIKKVYLAGTLNIIIHQITTSPTKHSVP